MTASERHAINVWVVEDEAPFRDTLRYLLDHTKGLRCGRSFGSVEETLEWVGERRGKVMPRGRPDVLLLDVNLPGMSGVEGLGELKAQLPETRVLMLTIRDDADTIYAALGAGASGYLVKNAGVDQIVAGVREAYDGGMLMPAPVARMVLSFFRRHEAERDYGLTDREREVLAEMVQGRTQREIAERLFISPYTVNSHVQHVYEKLHVHSGSAAVAKAVRERLVANAGSGPPPT